MFPSFEPNYIEDSIAKFHASSCSQAKAKVGLPDIFHDLELTTGQCF